MNKNFYAFALLIFPFLFPLGEMPAQTGSLLWKISGNGLDEPSFLYGTMHVGDKRAYKFGKEVMPSFNGTDIYAGELNMEDMDPMAVMNLMKLPEGETLEQLFTEEEWQRLDAHFKENFRTSITAFNQFNIFFVYSMMAQSSFKNEMGEAVDMYFFNQAKEQGKELKGLETIEEQIAAINRMPVEDQKKMLMDALEDQNSGDKEMKKMLKYYSKGRLDKLEEMLESDEMGGEFETAMIVERNYRMAERMVPLMEQAPSFVAVGALHLPGEEGVISLLRKAGYTVEAVK